MPVCPVCRTEFDAVRYQVVVSALGGQSFHSIECARIALAEKSQVRGRQRRRRPPLRVRPQPMPRGFNGKLRGLSSG